MLSAIVFTITSRVLKMPSEAYPAVYWQYFAVHFIVQGREQMRVLKDSTVCPRGQPLLFHWKGQPGQPQSKGREKVRDHALGFNQK